ncbi:MAG: DUF4163 domain-containing protein [bacterium]|nr:DUF4163 domain-containing protein [bacterium]
MRAKIVTSCVATLIAAASAQSLKVDYRTERKREGDFYTMEIRTPRFPTEKSVGALANREVDAIVNQFKRDFLQAVAENRKSGYRVGEPFQLQVRPTVSIARADLISLHLEVFWWAGGAHPNTYLRVVNVGLMNGKPRLLKLRDILERGASEQEVMRRVTERLEATKRQREPSEEPWMPEGGIPREYWNSFILTPRALVWVFEPYAVGAYAEGAFFIRIPYSELQGLVQTRWLPQNAPRR